MELRMQTQVSSVHSYGSKPVSSIREAIAEHEALGWVRSSGKKAVENVYHHQYVGGQPKPWHRTLRVAFYSPATGKKSWLLFYFRFAAGTIAAELDARSQAAIAAAAPATESLDGAEYGEFQVKVDGRQLKTYNELRNAREIAQQWKAAGHAVTIVGARFAGGEWHEGNVAIEAPALPELTLTMAPEVYEGLMADLAVAGDPRAAGWAPTYDDLDSFVAANCPTLPLSGSVDELARRAEALAREVDDLVRVLDAEHRALFDKLSDYLSPSGSPRDLEGYAAQELGYRERQALADAISRLKTAGQGLR